MRFLILALCVVAACLSATSAKPAKRDHLKTELNKRMHDLLEAKQAEQQKRELERKDVSSESSDSSNSDSSDSSSWSSESSKSSSWSSESSDSSSSDSSESSKSSSWSSGSSSWSSSWSSFGGWEDWWAWFDKRSSKKAAVLRRGLEKREDGSSVGSSDGEYMEALFYCLDLAFPWDVYFKSSESSDSSSADEKAADALFWECMEEKFPDMFDYSWSSYSADWTSSSSDSSDSKSSDLSSSDSESSDSESSDSESSDSESSDSESSASESYSFSWDDSSWWNFWKRAVEMKKGMEKREQKMVARKREILKALSARKQ